MGKTDNVGHAVPAGVPIIEITDMKNFTKKTTRRRSKTKHKVDQNGLTANQRWANCWFKRNPYFGP